MDSEAIFWRATLRLPGEKHGFLPAFFSAEQLACQWMIRQLAEHYGDRIRRHPYNKAQEVAALVLSGNYTEACASLRFTLGEVFWVERVVFADNVAKGFSDQGTEYLLLTP